MFKRVIQSISICILMASMAIVANSQPSKMDPVEVLQDTESTEVVVPEATFAENEIDKTMAAKPNEEELAVPETTGKDVIHGVVPPKEPEIALTEEEIRLMALVVMAEAGDVGYEPEHGMRLVIDVILNRVESERFPNTVEGVIYSPDQFAVVWNGRLDDCYVSEHICQLIREEAMSRTNYDVLFFRTNYYHSFGTPLFQVGSHYFSGV